MTNKVKTTNNPDDTFSKSIDLYDSEYFSINKLMLRIFGQWPYQSSRDRKIAVCILPVFSLSLLVPQTWAMYYARSHLDDFSECFSPWGTHVCCVVKLYNFMLQQKKLRSLLDDTWENWKNTKHPSQINILKEYGRRGRNWSMMWLILVYAVSAFWFCLAMLPKILDAVRPLNESRPTFVVIRTEYGIDQEKYWWWIQLHIWTACLLFLGVAPAVDGLCMTLAQHICAMFEISRYNLENIINEENENVDVVLSPDVHEDIHFPEVVLCIKKHKHIIKYVRDLASTNEKCLLFIVGFNMVGLSITSYQAVADGTETVAAMRFALFSFALLVHLFVITLPGQWIMEASSCFPNSVYSCKWYLMSLRTRRLIMLVIRASIEPCVITAGKIYVMSIENFCGVLQTAMSYLTVLTSM